jgi:hypothetical protein
LGKKANSAPQLIESDGSFITKTTNIANYFNTFLIGKISKLRHDMPATNADTTHSSITDKIMKDKHCNFEFRKVSVEEVKKIYCCLLIMTSHLDLSVCLDLKITEDNIRRYCHSCLPYLQSKPTIKCVPSCLEGSKSHSATQE